MPDLRLQAYNTFAMRRRFPVVPIVLVTFFLVLITLALVIFFMPLHQYLPPESPQMYMMRQSPQNAFYALVEAGNLEATVDNWAEDAVMLPPGPPVMPALEGRSAIQAYIEAAAQIPGWKISWEPKSVYVSRSGDLAYMLERNVVTVADSLGNDVTTYGKVVTVWRKDGSGRWRNVVDMWNEAPPPAN